MMSEKIGQIITAAVGPGAEHFNETFGTFTPRAHPGADKANLSDSTKEMARFRDAILKYINSNKYTVQWDNPQSVQKFCDGLDRVLHSNKSKLVFSLTRLSRSSEINSEWKKLTDWLTELRTKTKDEILAEIKKIEAVKEAAKDSYADLYYVLPDVLYFSEGLWRLKAQRLIGLVGKKDVLTDLIQDLKELKILNNIGGNENGIEGQVWSFNYEAYASYFADLKKRDFFAQDAVCPSQPVELEKPKEKNEAATPTAKPSAEVKPAQKETPAVNPELAILQETEDQITALQTKYDTLNQHCTAAETDIQDLQRHLEELQRLTTEKVERLTSQIAASRKEQTAIADQLPQLQSRREVLQTRIQDQATLDSITSFGKKTWHDLSDDEAEKALALRKKLRTSALSQ